MSDFKISQIAKKSMKVAVNNVVNTPSQVLEPEPVEEQIVSDIQASKTIKLTKKGKPDNRGKNLDNLVKGRAKLQESWDTKRALKEQMAEAALQKKMNLVAKQKKQIEKTFGVEDVPSDIDDDDEIIEELKRKEILEAQAVNRKPLTGKKPKKQPVAHVLSKAEPPAPPLTKAEPPPLKAPKKKIIKYVEVETSSEEESEEEEIVYVKRQKAPASAQKSNTPKPIVKSRSTPIINSPYPQIVFY